MNRKQFKSYLSSMSGILFAIIFSTIFLLLSSYAYCQSPSFLSIKNLTIQNGEKDEFGNCGWIKYNNFPSINHEYPTLFFLIYLPSSNSIIFGNSLIDEFVYICFDGSVYSSYLQSLYGEKHDFKILSEEDAERIASAFYINLNKMIKIEERIWNRREENI